MARRIIRIERTFNSRQELPPPPPKSDGDNFLIVAGAIALAALVLIGVISMCVNLAN